MSLDGVPILFVNNFAHDFLGGGEVHLLHLVRAAVGAGMRVTALAAPGSAMAGVARDAGASVVERRLAGRNPAAARRAVRDAVASSGARIVQGTGYFSNLLVRSGGGAGHPVTLNTVHTMPLAIERRSLAASARAVVDRLTAGGADAFVADAHAVARAYLELGLPADKMHVVHNAVDPAEVRAFADAGPIPDAVIEAREEGGPLLVVVGRLEPVKGIHEMLDAMHSIAQHRPDVRLLWAGAGDLSREVAERVADDPVLRDSVRLLGYVENAHALLGQADVVVMPSRAEGFNTMVLEAMALGKPVVATAVGGTPEAVIDGETGVLVPPGDTAALAGAVLSLLGDSCRRTAMGAAGRIHVEEHFTVAQMKREYLELYRTLLAERTSKAKHT